MFLASSFTNWQVSILKCWNGEKGVKEVPPWHALRRGKRSPLRVSGDAHLASKGEDRTPNGVGSRLAYGAIAHSKSQCPPFACDWNPWNVFGFIFLSDELCDIFRCFAISYKASWACPKGFVGCKGEEGGPHFISFDLHDFTRISLHD